MTQILRQFIPANMMSLFTDKPQGPDLEYIAQTMSKWQTGQTQAAKEARTPLSQNKIDGYRVRRNIKKAELTQDHRDRSLRNIGKGYAWRLSLEEIGTIATDSQDNKYDFTLDELEEMSKELAKANAQICAEAGIKTSSTEDIINFHYFIMKRVPDVHWGVWMKAGDEVQQKRAYEEIKSVINNGNNNNFDPSIIAYLNPILEK